MLQGGPQFFSQLVLDSLYYHGEGDARIFDRCFLRALSYFGINYPDLKQRNRVRSLVLEILDVSGQISKCYVNGLLRWSCNKPGIFHSGDDRFFVIGPSSFTKPLEATFKFKYAPLAINYDPKNPLFGGVQMIHPMSFRSSIYHVKEFCEKYLLPFVQDLDLLVPSYFNSRVNYGDFLSESVSVTGNIHDLYIRYFSFDDSQWKEFDYFKGSSCLIKTTAKDGRGVPVFYFFEKNKGSMSRILSPEFKYLVARKYLDRKICLWVNRVENSISIETSSYWQLTMWQKRVLNLLEVTRSSFRRHNVFCFSGSNYNKILSVFNHHPFFIEAI